MPTAYLYSRYSSPAQAKGDSTRRQLTSATSFADVHGLTLDTSLRDEGISGFTGKNRTHGALGSFLARVEAGEIAKGSYLLLDSIDRLSRESINQVASMLSAITLAGIKIVNLSDGHVFDEGADLLDWMRFLIHVERANAESKEKGRKVAAAHEAGRVRARADRTPYTPVGPHWLKLVGKTWEEVPERVAIVRRIFNMREEGLGYAAIAKTLNKEGVPTATGKGNWASATVRGFLMSRCVLGECQLSASPGHGQRPIPQGDPIEGFYPAIISADQFYRVQAIALGRRHPKAAPKSRKFNNLLVGLVTCKACGGPVGYAESTFPTKAHWKVNGVLRCNSVSKGVCTNRVRIPYAPLEEDLLRLVTALPLRDRVGPDPRLAQLGVLEGELAALDVKIESLLDQLEVAGPLAAKRLREREQERHALSGEIEKLRVECSTATVVTIKDKQEALAALTAEMADATGDKLFAIRASINAALKRFALGYEMARDQIEVLLDVSQISTARHPSANLSVSDMVDIGRSRSIVFGFTDQFTRKNPAWRGGRPSSRLPE